MTQSELAEKSSLSLRTIQRIEAGQSLKGFTLKTIANALQSKPESLITVDEEPVQIDRAKIINLSALSGLILPFGSVIFPLILTYQTKDQKNKEIGKDIVSVHIILATILSLTMIISPFAQHAFQLPFPLFIIPLILLTSVKVGVIIKNGISLNQKQDLAIKLKNSFL